MHACRAFADTDAWLRVQKESTLHLVLRLRGGLFWGGQLREARVHPQVARAEAAAKKMRDKPFTSSYKTKERRDESGRSLRKQSVRDAQA